MIFAITLNRIHLIDSIVVMCKPFETIISYSIKKDKDIKDSNGVNMAEFHIDLRSNGNEKLAMFSIGQCNFVAKSLALKEICTWVSYLILKYEFYVPCKNNTRIKKKLNTFGSKQHVQWYFDGYKLAIELCEK